MQSIKQLERLVGQLATGEHYLFASVDLRAGLPDLSDAAFDPLLSRAVRAGVLERVCRGIYVNARANYSAGLVLYHAAARLRAGHFLYLSLETVLSQHGVISQIPINRITLMCSGRGGIIDGGRFGRIEFTHTKKSVSDCAEELSYDAEKRLWVASAPLAYRDLKRVGRNLDLIEADFLSTQNEAQKS